MNWEVALFAEVDEKTAVQSSLFSRWIEIEIYDQVTSGKRFNDETKLSSVKSGMLHNLCRAAG